MPNKSWFSAAFFVLLLSAPLFLSDFRLNLLGKYVSFAILAAGLGLLWRYTGLISLGHGVYFGLGAYGLAMYLKLESTAGKLPDFMAWSGLNQLPWFWEPFGNLWFALAMVVIVPAAVAAVLGYLTFRSRINGIYFSIFTQALSLIAVTLFIGQQGITGGTNGITNFKTFLGYALKNPHVQITFYLLSVTVLALIMSGIYLLGRRPLGQVLIALRDSENRLRFIGYDPTAYKTFIYCLSAAISGIAGALFVVQVGIISPSMMGIMPSIEMLIWVAIGGRDSLWGPVLGAFIVNGTKTALSEAMPDIWLFLLGAVFIGTVLFFPRGIAGIYPDFRRYKALFPASLLSKFKGV